MARHTSSSSAKVTAIFAGCWRVRPVSHLHSVGIYSVAAIGTRGPSRARRPRPCPRVGRRREEYRRRSRGQLRQTRRPRLWGRRSAGCCMRLGPARAVWFVRLLICDGGGVVLNHRFRRVRAGKAPVTAKSIFSGIHYIRERRNFLGASRSIFSWCVRRQRRCCLHTHETFLHTRAWGLGLLRLAPAVGRCRPQFPRPSSHSQPGRTPHVRGRHRFRVATVALRFRGMSGYRWPSFVCWGLRIVTAGGAVVAGTARNAGRDARRVVREIRCHRNIQSAGEFESGVTASWFRAHTGYHPRRCR